MANVILISIIVIAVVLVVLALLVWRRRKEGKLEGILEGISKERKKAFFSQWIVGIVLALTAAAFMFDGDILGENTTGISTVMGIVGICLIATSNVQLLPPRRK
jgi:Na+/H+ antiporter NhaD/arsenite permease-like protein